MQIRDRVRELRRVRAGDLRPSPRNWRTHPLAQRDALKGVLAEIGYADALLVREVGPEAFELIDGHLRAETTPDALVPVLVLDVTEDEAAKLLATLDPLAAMATADAAALDALLRDVQTGSQAVGDMLTDLAASGVIPKRLPADPANDPAAEWQGMPEFENEPRAVRTIPVHFRENEAVEEFARILGVKVTDSTKYLYFPQ